MSYRSDVRFRLLKDDYAKLEKDFFANATDDYEKNFWENKDIYKEEKDSKTIYFGWDGVKWYRHIGDDAFKFVDFIMDFVLDLDTYSYGIIGEELDDVDLDGNGEIEYISVARSFEDDTQI